MQNRCGQQMVVNVTHTTSEKLVDFNEIQDIGMLGLIDLWQVVHHGKSLAAICCASASYLAKYHVTHQHPSFVEQL